MKPIAFVIPWYGDNIKGGAESECNQLAHLLQENNIPVEVLTTCVKQASDNRGVNTLPEGLRMESNIPVRRFTVKKQNLERLVPANQKLYNNEKVTLEEERAYLEEDINSPDMYRYIRKNREKYTCFIFLPYLYGVTYFGSMECLENAVLMPCLHDEGYAHMRMIKEWMNGFRKMVFLSSPERELAERLYGLEDTEKEVVGAYVASGWENSLRPDLFREKYHLSSPFLLFAGRKDAGKKADLLLDYYIRYQKRKRSDLKLVFIGGGNLDIPEEFSNDIIDLGYVSEEDKHNAMAACMALCNPSFFESFSIVIMEGWLAKRPALVSEQCRVTTNFCQESNGGLWFDSYPVFEGCVDYLRIHPNETNQMGLNGQKYVQNHFTKEVVLNKLIDFLRLV